VFKIALNIHKEKQKCDFRISSIVCRTKYLNRFFLLCALFLFDPKYV